MILCKTCKREFTSTRKNAAICDNCRAVPHSCGCGECSGLVFSWKRFYAKECPNKIRAKSSGSHSLVCKTCSTSFIGPRRNTSYCSNCTVVPRSCACGICALLVLWPQSLYALGCKNIPIPDNRLYRTKCQVCSEYIDNSISAYAICTSCKKSRIRTCLCCDKVVKTRYAKYAWGHYPISKNSHKISKPERLLQAALDSENFLYTGQNNVDLGQPISADFIGLGTKLIVQVDGCYWHECPQHGRKKYLDRPKHDAKKTDLAVSVGWTVLRFWEHDILKNLDAVVSEINSKRLTLLPLDIIGNQ